MGFVRYMGLIARGLGLVFGLLIIIAGICHFDSFRLGAFTRRRRIRRRCFSNFSRVKICGL
jgi:hypothetical protein